ncbi:MAG TPA: fused MFS/spermidine synthase [Myxococcota bacterium]|jgi:spermidine synthase|nr:fused MFS/spermidine synthase [Myxococcota bacterium]
MSGLYAARTRRRSSDSRVEVREGRNGRALRVDGTFASWYVPGRAHTGSVWDALAAPLCWLPPTRRRAVLVLGLGAGSAARLVRALAPRARIVGVERSAEVLRAARRHFDLDALGVEIVHADAREYLAESRAHFDIVIEDLFVGTARTVRKPDWVLASGLAAAARRLSRGGILVANSIDEAPAVARALSGFPARVELRIEGWDNRVVVGGPAGLDARGLRDAVSASPVLASSLRRLSFRSARAALARPDA